MDTEEVQQDEVLVEGGKERDVWPVASKTKRIREKNTVVRLSATHQPVV